jgi:hypothetical protein
MGAAFVRIQLLPASLSIINIAATCHFLLELQMRFASSLNFAMISLCSIITSKSDMVHSLI